MNQYQHFLLAKVNTLFRVPSSFYFFFSFLESYPQYHITFSPHDSLSSSRVWTFLKVSMLLMTERAGIIDYHKSGNLKQHKFNLFSHSSGGEKPKIKVSTELSSLWKLQGRILPCSSSFWWLLLTFGFPWLVDASLQSLSLPLYDLCLLCLWVQIPFFS